MTLSRSSRDLASRSHRLALTTIFAAAGLVAACSSDTGKSKSNDCGAAVCISTDTGQNQGTNGADAGGPGSDAATGGDSGTGCILGGCGDQVCNTATGACVDCVTDNECGANAACDPTANTCSCKAGFHDCNGTCADDTDPATCGSSCDPCPTDPNGTASCDQGTCGLACHQPYQLDPTSNACVQCVTSADCTDPTAARCEAGTCVACTAAADCSHLAATPICDATGACVACTVDDESACNGNSCDPASGTCTQTPVGSVGQCGACAADSECATGFGCAPMDFDGTTRTSGYCLPIANPDCSAPLPNEVQRTSLSGASMNFCTLNENTTTCEALLDYGNGCADASQCGAAGLDDARCEPIDFDVAACTFECTTSDECPSASLTGCSTGAANTKWCGAY